MHKFSSALVVLLAVCLIATLAVAQDEPAEVQQEETQGDMPPMGPPEEMQQLADMVGTWKFDGEMKMDPQSDEWMPFAGTAVFEYDVDGAAMRMDYTSEFMGQPFIGQSMTAYDRETQKWQEIWIDNMAARISVYTGNMEDGKRIMTGKEIWGGQEVLSRQISSDFTDTTFYWVSESSFDNGETWHEMMRGTYTKQM